MKLRINKKILQKISILCISICLVLTANNSKAYLIEPQEDVWCITTSVYKGIEYEGKALDIPIAKCKNKDFPIYVLGMEKYYLNGEYFIYTKMNETLLNEKVRQVLLLGYPKHSYKELNCTNEEEAYIITQIAVLDTYYHYDLEKFTLTQENKYEAIISNTVSLIQKARSSQEALIIPKITIQEETEKWQKEGENIQSKTYKIDSSIKFENYAVKVNAEGLEIKSEQNEEKEKFSYGEKFKIVGSSLEEIDFTITITLEAETKPVRKGDGPTKDWESYVYLDEKEIIETVLEQKYIKIEELDNIPEENPPKLPSKDEEEKIPEQTENKPSNNEENIPENKEDNSQEDNKPNITPEITEDDKTVEEETKKEEPKDESKEEIRNDEKENQKENVKKLPRTGF